MTILKLLQQGARIEFPSGYILKGDPQNRYIECLIDISGMVYPDGLRILDRDGVRLALNDAKAYEKEQKEQNA